MWLCHTVVAAAVLLAHYSVDAVGVDVPAKLYALYKQGMVVDGYDSSLPALPNSVTSRLGDTAFLDLPGALQRALLWDSGLVLTSDGKSLVQVLVSSSKTIQDIFLSEDTIKASNCSVKQCNSEMLYYAMSSCTAAEVSSYTRCAVYSNVTVEAKALVWAVEGDFDQDSVVRLYSYTDSDTDKMVYTIVEKPDNVMTDQYCPSKPSFIIPCQSISPTEISDAFKAPVFGQLVTMWLAEEANSSSTTAIIWKILAISFIGLFGITILVLVPILIWCLKKKRQKHVPARAPSIQYSSAPPPYAGMGDNPSGQRSVGLSYASTHQSSISNSDIERYNAELCRQSGPLAAFCNDEELVMKRIGYSTMRFRLLMAKGAYGEVWRGEFEGKEVAIKRLISDKRGDIRAMEVFAKEVRLASSLDHPNIVRYIGVSWRSLAELSMVSEFMPRGDLAHFLKAKGSQQLTWRDDKLPLSVSIANALVYLHSLAPAIVHRDIKSLNVLLSEDMTAKLTDFGLSREWAFDQAMTSGVGTLLWTAPEVVRGERYTEKADVYSFGIVLSELDTCLLPFAQVIKGDPRQMNNMEALPLIRSGMLKPQFRSDCPPALRALALTCVDNDPTTRPNAMQIVYMLRSKVGPTL